MSLSLEQLGTYINRLGIDARHLPRPTLETLTLLQYHHVNCVPFENLSLLVGDD